MKGLLKYLSPFAPDQSGAVEVMYELGGIIVICDAGGCTGNVCGFDEPRWFERKSAVFSAGLRDMDAILGRDDKLVEKLKSCASKIDAEFAAIVSTPVPAVIATDLKALKRMSEKRVGIPTAVINATGTGLYDVGEEEAYMELVKIFSHEKKSVQEGKINVIGATPFNLGFTNAQRIKDYYISKGYKSVNCFGFGSGTEVLKEASSAEKNIVISPSGIKCAEYLKEKFGTEYEIECPFFPKRITEELKAKKGKKILIIHQQVMANSLRNELLKNDDCKADVASWFMLKDELKEENDFILSDEKQFAEEIYSRDYDVIIADDYLHRALKEFKGEFVDFRHFAVSGKLED